MFLPLFMSREGGAGMLKMDRLRACTEEDVVMECLSEEGTSRIQRTLTIDRCPRGHSIKNKLSTQCSMTNNAEHECRSHARRIPGCR